MSKREKEIRIRVTENEYNIILNCANKNRMQVAPYVRMIAQNPIINKVDYSIIAQHTKEISEIRSSINRLIFTIEATNNYLPKDIQSIVEMVDAIFISENKLLRELRKARSRQYQYGRKSNIIRKQNHVFPSSKLIIPNNEKGVK